MIEGILSQIINLVIGCLLLKDLRLIYRRNGRELISSTYNNFAPFTFMVSIYCLYPEVIGSMRRCVPNSATAADSI